METIKIIQTTPTTFKLETSATHLPVGVAEDVVNQATSLVLAEKAVDTIEPLTKEIIWKLKKEVFMYKLISYITFIISVVLIGKEIILK